MNHLVRAFLLLIFFMFGFSSCQGQSIPSNQEEQQLRKEMDAWMKPYHREQSILFDQWIDWVENNLDDVWKHPVFRHMDSFYEQHQKQYLRLRKADLTRYPPAPITLPGYELFPDFHSAYKDQGSNMDDMLEVAWRIGNFRTLGVVDTRLFGGLLNWFIRDFIHTEMGLTYEQISDKHAYGERFFVDPIQGNQWRITQVNRLYVLKYEWDIESNQIANPELWLYKGEGQPRGWLSNKLPEVNSPKGQLYWELNEMRWVQYDQVESESGGHSKVGSGLIDKLIGFYLEHRSEYIQARNAELAKYPQLDTEYSKTFTQDVPDLKEDLLSLLEKDGNRYKLPDLHAAYEIDGSEIIYSFYYTVMRHLKNYAEYNLTAWIAGQDAYASQVDKNRWKIEFFYRKYAISFHWHTDSDELSDLVVRASES